MCCRQDFQLNHRWGRDGALSSLEAEVWAVQHLMTSRVQTGWRCLTSNISGVHFIVSEKYRLRASRAAAAPPAHHSWNPQQHQSLQGRNSPHPPTQANNPGSKNQSPALSSAAEEMPLDFELLEIISVRLEVLLQVFVGNQAKWSNILSNFSKSFIARQALQTGSISLRKRQAQHSLGTQHQLLTLGKQVHSWTKMSQISQILTMF